MVSRNVLSREDAARLDGLERVVRGGLQKFAEVASALLTIREEGLYKQYASTFDAYVQIRFEISRTHAYRYIAAAETLKQIGPGDSPTGESVTERVIRPLTQLPVEEQAPAWEEAKEAAKAEGKKKPTAAHTTAAVKARRQEKAAKRERSEAPEPERDIALGSTGKGQAATDSMSPGAGQDDKSPAEVGEPTGAVPPAPREPLIADKGSGTTAGREVGEGSARVRPSVVRDAMAVLVYRKLPNPTNDELLALSDEEAAEALALSQWFRNAHNRRASLLKAALAEVA